MYSISTSDNEKGLELLKVFTISAQIDKNSIICQFKKDSFDMAIKNLQSNDIKLVNIREHVNASEQMYQTMFNE